MPGLPGQVEAVMGELLCSNCDRLRHEIDEKDKRIESLQGEKVLLEYDLKEMRAKYWGRRKKKTEEQMELARPPKKRGAPIGHLGWFRKKPKRIDRTEEIALRQCPHCGSADLSECKEVDEHIQEDIVLPRPQVTLYRRHVYWCKGCKREVRAPSKKEAPGPIGPRAKALAAFLKYKIKMSQRDMAELFGRVCGLRVVPSSIPGFHNQLRRKGKGLVAKLKEKLKEAPYIHADETGIHLDGKNHWDWVFASKKICLHAVQKGRGQAEVEAILGKTYDGIVISDFLSAYNKIETAGKQRCLVHLLRDIKKALECSGEGDAIHTYCQRLKEVIQQAVGLNEQREAGTLSPGEFERQKLFLQETLVDFQFPNPTRGIIRRLSQRLTRHKGELFTFLDHPGLPYHNNFAERLIRPGVILRKIIFGCRSDAGVSNHNVLMSIWQTAQLNGKPILPLFQKLLTSDKPSLNWCLGP